MSKPRRDRKRDERQRIRDAENWDRIQKKLGDVEQDRVIRIKGNMSDIIYPDDSIREFSGVVRQTADGDSLELAAVSWNAPAWNTIRESIQPPQLNESISKGSISFDEIVQDIGMSVVEEQTAGRVLRFTDLVERRPSRNEPITFEPDQRIGFSVWRDSGATLGSIKDQTIDSQSKTIQALREQVEQLQALVGELQQSLAAQMAETTALQATFDTLTTSRARRPEQRGIDNDS